MSKEYEICTRGPCWKNFIYVGPEPGRRGSCVRKSKICGKETHKCYGKIGCNQIGGKSNNNQLNINNIKIPTEVKKAALLGVKLRDNGFEGGTQTGWDRGVQLSQEKTIDLGSLADMRTWFARHGPDASHGGTSYPKYCEWLSVGKPMQPNGFGKSNFKGAVSWLLWGGDPAYKWLKSPKIHKLLVENFPNRKAASLENNLIC